MDDALLGEVLDRLDTAELDKDTQLLVFAACEGDGELAAALRDEHRELPDSPEITAQPEPVGAYLTSLTVEGFRGVGSAATLELTPGPGLTLVVGRNGSGKSSFAEALEVLLTGDNRRWQDRSKAWQEGWRNLHHDGPTTISADLVEEGVPGWTRVEQTWPPGSGLVEAQARVQRQGQPKQDLAALGWQTPLVAFRPFLSYNELGSMLDEGPSKLYDALKAILGLDELTDAASRLAEARLDREKLRKGVKVELDGLLPRLAEIDDSRARTCHQALSGRAWRLDTVEAVVLETTDAPAAEDLTALRALASLEGPDAERAATVVRGLRTASARRADLAGTDAHRAQQVAGLLEAALAFHAEHAEADCPVCGRGEALDDAWQAAARRQAETLREQAAEVRAADIAVATAIRRAEELIDVPPRILADPLPTPVEPGTAPRDWQAWWDGWHTLGASDPVALADHIERTLPALLESLAALRRAAAAELERRQDEWRPVARELASWLSRALDAEVAAEKIPALKSAEKWLKQAVADLRDERFEPIAQRTKDIWETLRTHSNVDLGRVVLEGSGTRRRVALEVSVDGVEGVALGVMSQGELHALALSLFLPRATLEASPFRFIVIDDPVQSMDPARVDGLARTLEAVAADRQVIVFTHDERLPEATRRLQIDATVLEVTRRPGSHVEVREVRDPVTRLLEDARVLANTADLPAEVSQRVVPGFCRAALEAACVEAVRRRRLGRGETHTDVEQALEDARTTTQKAALALFDDQDKGGAVLNRLNAITKHGAATFKQVQKGTHLGAGTALQGLINDTEALARALRRQ
jgi:recombinational DNA repair ATPase RecF